MHHVCHALLVRSLNIEKMFLNVDVQRIRNFAQRRAFDQTAKDRGPTKMAKKQDIEIDKPLRRESTLAGYSSSQVRLATLKPSVFSFFEA